MSKKYIPAGKKAQYDWQKYRAVACSDNYFVRVRRKSPCTYCALRSADCNPKTTPLECAAHLREDGISVYFLAVGRCETDL